MPTAFPDADGFERVELGEVDRVAAALDAAVAYAREHDGAVAA